MATAKEYPRLTYKQTLFYKNWIKYEGNASEAYRQSYNCVKSSVNTVCTEAYKLLNHPYIAHRIAKAQEKVQDKLEITTETQVQKLEDVYNIAIRKEDLTPAISAINSQSKHLGLIQDKPTNINIHLIEAERQMRNVSPEKRAQARALLEAEFVDVSE